MQKSTKANGSTDPNASQSQPSPSTPPPRSRSTTGRNDAAYFDAIRQDDLDREMREPVQNLFSRQTILGNIDDAEHWELRWLVRNMVERVEAYFPPEESSIQGEYRAALLDDDEDKKRSLRNDQRELLRQSVWNYLLDLSRSKGGFQQQKLSDVHQISERRLKDERSSGGLRSVFD